MVSTITKTLSLLAAATVTLSSDVDASHFRKPFRRGDSNCLVGFTDFEFYIFAQSWQPEFCHGQSFEGCSSPEEFWEKSFTIHGLWPDIDSKQYPCDCSDEHIDLKAIQSVVPLDDMYQYWPNVKKSTASLSYSSFWDNEWLKHGTCSGLDQPTYFEHAIDLAKTVKTPSVIVDNVGKTVSAAAVRKAYGGEDMVILRCKGKYLAEIRTCWSREPDNTPGDRISCATKEYEDNCPEKISIASF